MPPRTRRRRARAGRRRAAAAPTRYGSASWPAPTISVAAGGEVVERDGATAASSAGTSGAASSSGPVVAVGPPRPRVAAASPRTRGRARPPRPSAARPRAQRAAQAPRRVARAEQRDELRVGRRGERLEHDARPAGSVPGEMGPDRLEVRAVEPRASARPAASRERARVLAADQARRAPRPASARPADAVGVVGRVAQQRVRDLRLAGEHGLGPRGLADRGDAGRRERRGSPCAC